MEKYILELRNIHKRFPGVYALKGANLQLRRGEVHALVGENGAGKSTLLNALVGIFPADEGEIIVDGQPLKIANVLDGQAAGVSMIHQELVLEPYLTVAENIFVNRYPMKNGFVDHKTMYEEAQKNIDELGLDLNAKEKLYNLSIAQQQMVEIVKATSFNSQIIAMDEPTSSISDKEVAALFKCIRTLKEKGISIVYISHRLSELEEICDRVTIMRDGETVGTYDVGTISTDEIVRQMVGREITNYYVRDFRETVPDEDDTDVIFEARGITSNKVRDVSFKLHKGEILGFAGLVGAGRTETMLAILGLDKKHSGEVFIDGKQIDITEPIIAYENGIGYIPENRRDQGIVPLQTVQFNISLKVLNQFIHGIRLNRKQEEGIADEFIQKLSIKTPGKGTRIQNLSGGNQQKAVISSWLAGKPKILIMDEPTRGIDVGAKAEIYTLMNQLAKDGIGIIMISSELPEIINISDRVIVMREGEISKVIMHEEATQEEIMKYAVSI